MNKANRRSALTLALGVAAAVAAVPLPCSAADDLKSPVFVTPAEPAQSISAQPATPPADESQAASPGRADESDRAEPGVAASTPVMPAPREVAVARAAPVVAAAGEHSVWSDTSLIGKIFIGFGALLTIGSAARMFMA